MTYIKLFRQLQYHNLLMIVNLFMYPFGSRFTSCAYLLRSKEPYFKLPIFGNVWRYKLFVCAARVPTPACCCIFSWIFEFIWGLLFYILFVFINTICMCIFAIHDVPATILGTIATILRCKRTNIDLCPVAGERPYITLFTYIFEFIAYIFIPIPTGISELIGGFAGDSLDLCECGEAFISDSLDADFCSVPKIDSVSERETLSEVFTLNGLDSYRDRYDVYVHDPRGQCGINCPTWYDTFEVMLLVVLPLVPIKACWGEDECFGVQFEKI